jgi:hypothetical protein
VKGIRINEELWLEFRIEVLKEKETIENVIETLISNWLKRRG